MKVLVTNATRNTGLAVIRGLGKGDCKVIGADNRQLPLNIHSRYAQRYYLHPELESDDFLDILMRIIQEEHPDVILPVSGTKQVSENKASIQKYTNVLVPDYESFVVANDKKRTLEECHKLSIPCPRILTEKEAIAILNNNSNKKAPNKVVVKPKLNAGGSQGVCITDSPEVLKRAIAQNENTFGESVMEEYIPGKERMRTLNLLFDKSSRLVAYFTTRKIRQWPSSCGQTALSISTNDWNLVEMVLPFFKKWRWKGPAEVELKLDSTDDKPKLIEINPRLWSYIDFPIRCGVNFPLIACKIALDDNNQVRRCPRYPIGVKYLNLSYYMKSILSDVFSGEHKTRVLLKVLEELKGQKVSNNLEMRDLMVNVAKFFLQLSSRNS